MSTSTTPSGLSKVAPTGQTCTQGEWAQWLQSLGTKKFFEPSPALVLLGEAVVAAVRASPPRGARCRPSGDVVALHPGAEVEGLAGDVVLRLAGAHAVAAADALLDVDDHPPPVVGHLVVRGRLGLSRPGRSPRPARRPAVRISEQLRRGLQELPAVGRSSLWRPPDAAATSRGGGACGRRRRARRPRGPWDSPAGTSWAWPRSRGGRRGRSSWGRGAWACPRRGPPRVACLAWAPWHASQAIASCLLPLRARPHRSGRSRRRPCPRRRAAGPGCPRAPRPGSGRTRRSPSGRSGPQDEEDDQPTDEEGRHPDQVLLVLEQVLHARTSLWSVFRLPFSVFPKRKQYLREPDTEENTPQRNDNG